MDGYAWSIWSPPKSGFSVVGSGCPSTAWYCPAALWVPYSAGGSGMKSSLPVWTRSARISSGFFAFGRSTRMRSVPSVWTIGSATPVELTRFSMIVFVVARAPASGSLPPTGWRLYTTSRPPTRSSPSFVSTTRVPPLGSPKFGMVSLGQKSTMRKKAARTTMMIGVVRRIGGDAIRLSPAPSDGPRRKSPASSVGETRLDPLGEGPSDPRNRRDLLDGRFADALRGAECSQQRTLAGRTDSRQVVER